MHSTLKKLAPAVTALALASAASAAPLISPQSIIVNPVETDLKVSVSVDKDPSGSRTPDYFVGEFVRISTSVNQDAYVYLFNVNVDGSIDQILPNRFSGGDNFVKANTVRTFGGQGDAFRLNIAAPFGVNKVLALASKTPLNLSDIADFRQSQSQPNSLEITVTGQTNLARALSIVVTPIPQNSWTTDTVQYNVAQQRQTAAQLVVDSNVQGADVYVDNVLIGRTPLTRAVTTEGRRTVRVSAPGYADFVTTVNVRAGQTVNVSANLAQVVRSGTISVSANVQNAEVFVNNRRYGVAPANIADLNPGTYSVRVSAPGYSDFVTTVTVRAGQTVNVTANLAQVIRRVNVTVRANVAQGDVYLDGARVGSLQNGLLSFQADQGPAEIVILAPGYRVLVQNTTLQSDVTLNANLGRL